jgi:hypothetical protein
VAGVGNQRPSAAGHGKGRRRCSLAAALSTLALVAGLALVSPSAADVPNTWSGTWVNSAPDGSFWVFSQSAGGVGGVWKGNASSGSLSGTIQGSTLTGTLVNNEAGQSANFSITLSADGHSFSGTFTIQGGSTGQWRSTCTGGACLNNAAPPPPPPPPPPGGGTPAAQASPKVLAAVAAWGQAGPAVALAPGSQAIATSPPIARNQKQATVTVTSGQGDAFTDLTFGAVNAAKPRPKARFVTLRGNCVRFTASVYKDTLRRNHYDFGDADFVKDYALSYAYLFLRACLESVKEREAAESASAGRNTGASRMACKARALPLNVTVNRAAGVIQYGKRKASRRDAARRLRSSCKRAPNGTITLRLRSASRRTKLRKILGPRLVVGTHRSTKASSTANVQVGFKR